jgi:putative peptide zinc metalloprotease protein
MMRPKARTDLRVSKQEEAGQIYYVIADPDSGKYVRLREPEYVILRSLDGRRTPEEISGIVCDETSVDLQSSAIEAFIGQLERFHFLEGEKPGDQSDRLERDHKKRQSLFFLRFRAFNPERFVDWLYLRLRFMFSQVFLILSLVPIGIGLYILTTLPNSIPYSAIDILRLSTIVVFVAALFIVIVVHEFAHAVVCRRYGGRVTEMGFLLIYFQPAFYCNLSDSYMFPKKAHRIYTILAGMYFQILLGSFSLILWRISKLGTPLSDLLFVIMVVSFGTLVFNLNPLLKLDGYYFLTDLTGIPNLRRKAFGHLRRLLLRFTLGIETSGHDVSSRERRIYIAYSLAAIVYTAVLLIYLGSLLFAVLLDKWGGTGFLLFVAILAAILGPPLRGLVSDVAKAVREDAVGKISRKRTIAWSILLLVLILLLVVVRTELRVSSQARLSPIESFTILMPEENVLKSIYFAGGERQFRNERVCQLASADFSVFSLEPLVENGAIVVEGDTLLSVSSNLYKGQLAQVGPELDKARAELNLLLSDPKSAEITKARAEVDEAKLRRRRAANEYERAQGMYDRGLIPKDVWDSARTERDVAEKQVQIAESRYELLKSGPKAEEISVLDAELERLEARKSYLLEQIDASTFTAPFGGVISASRRPGEIISLKRTDTIEVRIVVPEEDLDIVTANQKVILKVASYPTMDFEGRVVSIQEVVAEDGEMSIFTAISVVHNPDGLLRSGMSGYAKIYCGKRSLGGKLIRSLTRFFRVEFWSWW